MGLNEDLQNYVKNTHRAAWSSRAGQSVPDVDSLTLKNEAVKFSGTVLYADLAESTDMVRSYTDWFAAEVYKNYLYCAARIIRSCGGEITAYDGDRVMAVFMGNAKNSNAARAALRINYAVQEILQPAIDAAYTDNSYKLKQKVGIDTSELFVAKTGIRGNNDLVWVGNAANNAAKMAALSAGYGAYISQAVRDDLDSGSRYGSESPHRDMWSDLGSSGLYKLGTRVYGSNWIWSF